MHRLLDMNATDNRPRDGAQLQVRDAGGIRGRRVAAPRLPEACGGAAIIAALVVCRNENP